MKLQASPASKKSLSAIRSAWVKPRVILGTSPDTLILFAWHTCYGQDTCDSVMSPWVTELVVSWMRLTSGIPSKVSTLFHVFPASLALIEPLAPVSLAHWSTLTSPTLPCQWHWGPAGSLGAGASRQRAGHRRIWWSCWGDSRHLYHTPALATWTCSMWYCRTWIHWTGSVWKQRGEKKTTYTALA